MTMIELDDLRRTVWAVMKDRDWSIRYLSGASGVNYLTLRRWLNGSHDTTTEKLARILSACDLHIGDNK